MIHNQTAAEIVRDIMTVLLKADEETIIMFGVQRHGPFYDWTCTEAITVGLSEVAHAMRDAYEHPNRGRLRD